MNRLSFSYLDTDYFTKSKRLSSLIRKHISPEIKNPEIIQDIDLHIKKIYYLKNNVFEKDMRNGKITDIIKTITPKKIVHQTPYKPTTPKLPYYSRNVTANW